MTKVRTWVGLDVHAAKTVACVVDAVSGEMTIQRLSGQTSEVVACCDVLPRPVRAAYESTRDTRLSSRPGGHARC